MKNIPKPIVLLTGAAVGVLLGLVIFVIAWCACPHEVTAFGLLRTIIASAIITSGAFFTASFEPQ